MFGIPNLKYKTTICHSWQQGRAPLTQDWSATWAWDAFSLTASMSCAPWNK